MMREEMGWDAITRLHKFTIGDSDKSYRVVKCDDEYQLCEAGTDNIVGSITRTMYSFKVWTRISGLTMSKEVDYKDVNVNKG